VTDDVFGATCFVRRTTHVARRTVMIGACAIVLCVALGAPGSAQAPSPTDWPQFRRNHDLTGVAPGAGPATLKVLWTYEVGSSIDSSPAVSGGVVYVGSLGGDLVAVDLASGKLSWKYATGAEIAQSSHDEAR
jgi:hypothetical protein